MNKVGDLINKKKFNNFVINKLQNLMYSFIQKYKQKRYIYVVVNRFPVAE